MEYRNEINSNKDEFDFIEQPRTHLANYFIIKILHETTMQTNFLSSYVKC